VSGFSESREVGDCLLALQFFHEEATQQEAIGYPTVGKRVR
jgi:hypothetical protein